MIEMIILMALAVSAISFTITTTSIFEWLRNLISKIHPKLDELIHCPWCLSHYIALLVLYNDTTWGVFNISELIVLWFAIVCASGLFHYVLLRAYEPVVKEKVRREMERLKEKGNEVVR